MNVNFSYSKVLLFSRIVLGLVFLLSAIGKFINSEDAAYLVELMAYEIYALIEYRDELVLGLTIFEALLAVLLLWGRKIKLVFVLTFLFIAGLTSVLVYMWFAGYTIESCGCFGTFDLFSGFQATLIKNGVLLLITITGLVSSFLTDRDSLGWRPGGSWSGV